MLAICGGLMRTGSVAMFQIMREIAESQGLGYAPTFPVNRELEYWEKNVEGWAESNDLVVTKLHRWEDFLVPARKNLIVIMTIRDMRDVAVSLMNFRGGTFENAVNSNAFKANPVEQERWKEKAGISRVLKVRYEDFVLNRVVTTAQVAKFMGIVLPLVEAMKIEQKWSINANLKRAQKGYSERHPEYMSKRHIKSGKVGQFLTTLTPKQICEVQDRVGDDWFSDNGYELFYE